MKKGLLQIEHLKQPSHKTFDFVAHIDWFSGIKCPKMTVIDRQNQYQRGCRMQMRQPLWCLVQVFQFDFLQCQFTFVCFNFNGIGIAVLQLEGGITASVNEV